MHVELPLCSFLAACLVLVTLPWHWRARNVPTLSIVGWLFISNIIYGVNAVIWAGNVRIVAVVWCDIVTKIQMGATMSLPACCLCLCIRLEQIASIRQVSTSHAERRRRMLFDALLCWGVPLIYMALHYIVQGHRFDIVEDFGCRPSTYSSIQSILIIWALPLIFVILTSVYAGLALMHFFRRRLVFARHLQDSNSALNTSRYIRLMAMAIVQMFWGILVISINMWFTCRLGLRPWISWADVHSDFSRVDVYPTAFIPPFVIGWTYFIWWVIPISSVLFFAFFAFGEDAMKGYRACYYWMKRVVFRCKPAETTAIKDSLPSYSPPFPSKSSLAKANNSLASDSTQSPTSLYGSRDLKRYPQLFDDTASVLKIPTTPTSFAASTCPAYTIAPLGTHIVANPNLSPASSSTTLPIHVAPWRSTQDSGAEDIPLSPLSPPSPLPPPPRHPRLRESVDDFPPASPRPFTYPSHDASHRGINPQN